MTVQTSAELIRPKDSSAGEVVTGYLAGQVAALLEQAPRVRQDADEGVHQMRVAIRRLRTGLASFRPLFAQGPVQDLRAELSWLGGELGRVRDLEVLQAWLHEELAGQPVELVVGPVVRRVDLELRAERQEARAQALAALDSARYLALIDALERFVAEPPFGEGAAEPAGVELRRRVRKACRRVQRAYDDLSAATTGAERDDGMHQVRIAAKRARYAAEAVRPVHGRKAKRLAAAMEAVQESLGDHQDAVVRLGWLRDLAMRAFLAGENSFTLGRLHGLTDARAAHDEKAFAALWKRSRRQIADWPG